MTYNETLAITLIDKGLLAAVFLVAGFLLNALLERQKARSATLTALAGQRAEAFRELWRVLAAVRPTDGGVVAKQTRQTLDLRLTEWYHEHNGALFTSWRTTKQVLRTMDTARNLDASDQEVRTAVSLLRTRLKRDCGIYGAGDTFRELGTPRGSSSRV